MGGRMAKKKKARKSVPKSKKRGPRAAKRGPAKKRSSAGQRLLESLKTARRTTLTDNAGPRVLEVETEKEPVKPPAGGTDWGGARFRKE